MASSNPKSGKTLDVETVKTVRVFILSDAVSRAMPGKDCISIYHTRENEFMLRNDSSWETWRRVFRGFQSKLPAQKIGSSKFAELRPKKCVLAGSGGTHNLCVCAQHENVKLMDNSIHPGAGTTYHHYLAQMCCNPGTQSCFLRECE